jgi:hypothetical protein
MNYDMTDSIYFDILCDLRKEIRIVLLTELSEKRTEILMADINNLIMNVYGDQILSKELYHRDMNE